MILLDIHHISTINTANSQIYNNIPTEDSVVSLLNSYLDIYFDVLHAVTNNTYENGDDIRLVNLGPIALVSIYKLTTSSEKHLKDFNQTHIVSLRLKLKTSSKDSDDLSLGSDRDHNRKQRELTNLENIKRKYHIRIMPEDAFGFAEHSEKATYGLGYKLTLTRNSENSVLNEDNATNNGKIIIYSIEWYVLHYPPSIQQQAILAKQILSKAPKELQYVKRLVFMKEVNTQNLRSFELGTQEGINVLIWIIIGVQKRGRQDSQILDNDMFSKPPVTSAQCIVGTERYPDSTILLIYDDDYYSQGYGQIEEAFGALTIDDILKLYKTYHHFRSFNEGNAIGYNSYVFDLRYQRNLEPAQPYKAELKFSANIPVAVYGYVSVSTNKLVSISSGGQRYFELI